MFLCGDKRFSCPRCILVGKILEKLKGWGMKGAYFDGFNSVKYPGSSGINPAAVLIKWRAAGRADAIAGARYGSSIPGLMGVSLPEEEDRSAEALAEEMDEVADEGDVDVEEMIADAEAADAIAEEMGADEADVDAILDGGDEADVDEADGDEADEDEAGVEGSELEDGGDDGPGAVFDAVEMDLDDEESEEDGDF